MKHFSTFLLTALLLLTGMSSWGQSRDEAVAYTLDPIEGTNNSYAGNCDIEIDGITWNLTGNSTMIPWRIGGKSLTEVDRDLYSKTPIAENISRIEIEHGTADNITVNSLTLTVALNSDFTDPVSVMEVEFEASATNTIVKPEDVDWTNMYYKLTYNLTVSGSSNKFVQFVGAVFYSDGEGGGQEQEVAATPTFTPAGGNYLVEQNVTISTTTPSATIYYTLDETEPTETSTVYSEPITLGTTTTIKAIAVADGYLNSSVATATYTFSEPITIAEAHALENDTYACVEGVVTFIDGRNIYVQDETAGIDLFLNNNTVPTDLAIGDMVRAYGKRAAYNGLIELSGINGGNANEFSIQSSGNTLPLATKTIDEINDDYSGDNLLQCTRVMIEGAIIGAINTSGNTPIVQGENSINIYRMPVVDGLVEGDIVTVTGIIGCYNAPQLRVISADDVQFTHRPTISATPATLEGLTYAFEDDGPSEIVYFELSGTSLNGPVQIYPSESFEVSTLGGNYFVSENPTSIHSPIDFSGIKVYVRMKANLEPGTYEEQIYGVSDGADTLFVSVSGTVTQQDPEPPTPPTEGVYVRISDLNELVDGSYIVVAARFDENANDYYAMSNATSGKPTGVLFTSETSGDNEVLPAAIADEESSYYWVVGTTANGYTFTNANGEMIGYSTSTNFATDGDNTEWSIAFETAGENAMVPGYEGFYITNVNTPARGFALNAQHNYGAYAVSNNNNSGYNFYLDLFVKTEGIEPPTPVVATPTFNPAAGEYYEEQTVSIACTTEDATIYYTLDGTDPTVESTVYEAPISISETTTVKAIAMKEGFDNSAIAEATYTIIFEPAITVNPLVLTDFSFIVGNGPSEEQSFTFSGINLNADITITGSESFEISMASGDDFEAQDTITLTPENGSVEEATIYVRLKADLEVGEYDEEAITIACGDVDDIVVTCSGSVIEEPVLGDNYVRISHFSELVAGNRIIFAARFDENANDYYAMSNTTSGKPTGVLFTSDLNDEEEIVPLSILIEEDSYYWTVDITDDNYTFINAAGDTIGYTTGTNFATNGDNTAWSIELGTSAETAMVPNHTGFVISNVNNAVRAFALNSNHNFGPYHTQNITDDGYNFFLDIFMQGEGGVPPTPTVAAPTFDPAGGTYYEAQNVAISCATEGVTIYYSLESEEGSWAEYEGPIAVEEDMTIWAYATMEGYNDSPVVNSEYIIQDDLTILFNQDWEDDWNGWTEVSVLGDTTHWNIAVHNDNHYAYLNAYNQGENEDWLISPAFDLDTYPDAVLTFVTARNYNGPEIEVFFSNDYDGEDPTTATWQPLECALSQGSWNWTESGEISFEGYEGSNCYIAFKYTSTEDTAAAWEVDDIMLVAGGEEPIPTPTLTATPNSINNLEYMEGEGPSEADVYTLFAENLEGEGVITVSVSEYFEISLDDEIYTDTLEIAFADGELEDQPVTIYVRLAEGLEAGSYEGTISHEGGNATAAVSLTGAVHSENEPAMNAMIPLYIQGNNGSNNNRIPVAIPTRFTNLQPNTTYRYTNQFVVSDDGQETAGAGNVIYVNPEGFYRSTSPSLATEGGYGEFTTSTDGSALVWFMNETTANARFTPGNHIFMRVRLNDGNDGTTVEHIFTSEDYATVLNFGNENDEYSGSAFYVKSAEAPMNFALMYDLEGLRPFYATSIETTGVDYGNINQYADFYKEFVAGNDGWFGGILPNINENGLPYILIVGMDFMPVREYASEDGGFWYPNANTANPTNGLDEPIFIDLTYDGVEEQEVEVNVKVWSTDNEFVVENGDDAHYTMTVYNMLGQSMMQKQINASSTQRISHNLTSGLYIISLQNNQNMVSHKVIVR